MRNLGYTSSRSNTEARATLTDCSSYSSSHDSSDFRSSSFTPSDSSTTSNDAYNTIVQVEKVVPAPQITLKKKSKSYACEPCSKSFSRPSALKTHNYIHTDAKPFQCLSPGCGRRFSVVSNLRRHFKIHQRSADGNQRITSEDRVRFVRELIRRNTEPQSPDYMEDSSFMRRVLPYHPKPSYISLQTPNSPGSSTHSCLLPPVLISDFINTSNSVITESHIQRDKKNTPSFDYQISYHWNPNEQINDSNSTIPDNTSYLNTFSLPNHQYIYSIMTKPFRIFMNGAVQKTFTYFIIIRISNACTKIAFLLNR